MKELTKILENVGHQNVCSYLQSGNLIFQNDPSNMKDFVRATASLLKEKYGFEPSIILLTREEMQQAANQNPFPVADSKPKTVHLYFLNEEPRNPNFDRLNEIKLETEQFKLMAKVFYLHAPDGFGRSKLAAGAEKLLGTVATARNWATVKKLLEIDKRG